MKAEPAQHSVRTRAYHGDQLLDENFPIARVSDYLSEADTTVWVDLCAPDIADLRAVADELQVHELAIEDAIHPYQRPKLDRYASHEFLSMYTAGLDVATGELLLSELAAFITPHALVTVRKDDGLDISEVVTRWDASRDLAGHGVGYLLYGLIDYVVDTHFEVVRVLDEEIETLEDLLFAAGAKSDDVQRRTFELRKSLVTLRRVVLPMREVVNSLMRRDIAVVTDAMVPYFQDVYDHVLRATEWTESLRDLVTTILETNITIQGNRMNLIMKKVTSWAAIIAVPTAITGFYGQNLPYPGFAKTSGFIASTVIIVVLSGLLYVAFKRKDWL